MKEKPKVVINNSPNNNAIRTKLYDGKMVCSSRECCNYVLRKKSIYCRDKCEYREQNLRQNKVTEAKEKVQRKRAFVESLERTVVVTGAREEKRKRNERRRGKK